MSMNPNQQLTYAVDLALCIDCTGSMRQTLASVKEAAREFHNLLSSKMVEKGKVVTAMRVRVVAFRDLFADDPAFEVSQFFQLPQEAPEFEAFLSPLRAKGGGGDGPESAFEALSIAICSDWTKDADRLRHVVVMWTDAAPHPLEKGAEQMRQSEFAGALAPDINTLTDWWESEQSMKIQHNARRLVLFAPAKGPWTDIIDEWSSIVHFASEAGKGLRDFELDQIIDALASSI
jgi:hypothetical protein